MTKLWSCLWSKCQTGGEMWLRRPLEGEEELLLAAALETVYLLELSHILQVGLELPVKRATPFGPNMEQKEYSFWSQNRTKGVVEQYSWALSGLMRVTLSSSTWCPVWWCPAMDICLEILVMFDSSLYYSTQGHLISFVYFVILKASRW